MTPPPATPRLLLVASCLSGCYTPHDALVVTDSDSAGASSTDAASSSLATSVSNSSDVESSEGGVASTGGSGDSGDPVCGNAVVEVGEACDDGVNDGGYGGCAAGCSEQGPHCGDGALQADEMCDDGNAQDADGCNVSCVESGSVIWTRFFDDSPRGIAVDDSAASWWWARSPSILISLGCSTWTPQARSAGIGRTSTRMERRRVPERSASTLWAAG